MAHVAIPEDECRIGFDHLEGVFALSWFGHFSGGGCDEVMWSSVAYAIQVKV